MSDNDDVDIRHGSSGHHVVTVDAVDRMRWLTVLAISGALAAAILALIGGFPFDTPMPTHSFGWVEPTCGLTRGTTAAARGDLALAWRYNPLSLGLAALGFAGAFRAAAGLVTGSWINLRIRRPSIAGWAVLALAVVAFTLYQQSNADFIIHSRG